MVTDCLITGTAMTHTSRKTREKEEREVRRGEGKRREREKLVLIHRKRIVVRTWLADF